jgi:hypothetical protein
LFAPVRCHGRASAARPETIRIILGGAADGTDLRADEFHPLVA